MECNKKIKISCMGDSITFGLCASDMEHSYPSVLQLLLGNDYSVSNFGISGATVINDYDWTENRYSPYTKSKQYKQAMQSKPDKVVLMLGMNDANPTHHFNKENGGNISEYYIKLYQNTLIEIIDCLKKLPSNPNIYLIKTTEMKRKVEDGFDKDYIESFQANIIKIRKIQEKVAQEKDVYLIDANVHMQDNSYYHDGCHLTDKGYKKLAEIVYAESLKVKDNF